MRTAPAPLPAALRPDAHIVRPVYCPAATPPAPAAGKRPARPAVLRDGWTGRRVGVPAAEWVTVAGIAYLLGTAIDAEGSLLLVDFPSGPCVWVEERATIRPAAVRAARPARAS